MRKWLSRMSVLCTVLLFAFAPAFTHATNAQDSMTHTCDSTLITLLFIAENDFGYHSMTMDTSTFEKGEYAPLFEAMMANMDSSMGDTTMAPTEEMMGSDMTTEDSSMMGGDMMTLQPGVVADEDPACTALRADLETFFYDHYTMMDTGSGM